MKPVALPPGRAKLSTKPPATGSATDTNTTGTVRVARRSGPMIVLPWAKNAGALFGSIRSRQSQTNALPSTTKPKSVASVVSGSPRAIRRTSSGVATSGDVTRTHRLIIAELFHGGRDGASADPGWPSAEGGITGAVEQQPPSRALRVSAAARANSAAASSPAELGQEVAAHGSATGGSP